MSRSKTNRDRAKKQHQPAVEDKSVAAQLEQLLTPAIFAQSNYYRQLGLRNRILNLPLMLAAVLTLLWRNVPGVRELTRILDREGFLWCQPVKVSNQAAKASDTKFELDILNLATSGTLLLLDRGFYHFKFWQQLIVQEGHFITRLKKGAALQFERVLTNSYSIRDRVVRMGTGTEGNLVILCCIS